MTRGDGMDARGERTARWRCYGALAACLLAAWAVVWMCTEKTPWMHSVYCSYTLQAERWLSGHLDLGQDYPWLELAVCRGKYYVSFPPLPTVLVLPFVLLLGVERTPEYLITAAMGVIGAIQLLSMLRLFTKDDRKALLWALLATAGSNFLHIAFNGDVWLLAQTAAFMFTSAALFRAATDEEGDGKWPLLWLACAFGCRPFNIAYLPLVAWLLARKLRRNGLSPWGALRKHWAWLIPPLCVGGCYMALNAARFGDPFQFGHDYLPEFTEEHAQFALANLSVNFREKLFGLPQWSDDGRLLFPKVGFAFFIASPVYAVGFALLVRRLAGRLRGERGGEPGLVLLAGACVSLHLLGLCLHATMGGIQWGLRYTVDAIPAATLGIALLWRREDGDWPDLLALAALVFGLCLNLAGTLAILNDWSIFL